MYYDKVDKVYYETVRVEADAFVMKKQLASGFPDLDDNGLGFDDIHTKVKKSLEEKGYKWNGSHDYTNGAMTRGECCIVNEGFKNKEGHSIDVSTSIGCRGDYIALTCAFYDSNPDVIQKITEDVKDVASDVLKEFGKENLRKTNGYLHTALEVESPFGGIQLEQIDVDFNKRKKPVQKMVNVNLSPDYSKGKSDAMLHK